MTLATYSHGTLRMPCGDRLVHIGDSAHRASPQLGQGANMGLLDAAALASAFAHHGPKACCPVYVRSRRLHVCVYQLLSAAFTPQYQSNSRFLPLLRDRVLAPLSQIKPLQNILTRLVRGDLVRPIR